MSSEQQAFNDGFDKGYTKASEKIAQLESRVDRWIRIAHNIADRNGELEESLREEKSEVAQLEAYKEYARHKPSCPISLAWGSGLGGTGIKCDCGLDALGGE